MTKKKINILLLVVVLLIWGIVGYRSLQNYFFASNPLNTEGVVGSSTMKLNLKEKDTFDLKPIHKDPFTSKSLVTISNNPKKHLPAKRVSKPVVRGIAQPKAVLNITWPEMQYYGYIKSKDKTIELVLMKIKNKLYKVRKNDVVEGVLIKKVFNDSVEVYLNKERRVVRIK